MGAACLAAGAALACGADWPQWGGRDGRNMASEEEGLPYWFDPGKKKPDGSGIDVQTTKNVRWVVPLGTENYSSPVIAGGRVLIATNDMTLEDPRHKSTGGGVLLCLDEATGRLLWRLVVPKLEVDRDKVSSEFETMSLGICSTPTVDGDRVYLVTNRCEVLCLDVHGMADGNDGLFTDEAHYTVEPGQSPAQPGPLDGDILWKFDMLTDAPTFPHDAANCSVLVHGDLLYVGTSNGTKETIIPLPSAPSLIVLDKNTGRLAAKDDGSISARVFHGQWSSPSLGKVGPKTLVFYGGGDGMCYAFEALDAVPEKPVSLKKVWSFDCNPPEFKYKDGKPIDYCDGDKRRNPENKNDGLFVGPSEIIATPVFYNNRVYVAVGQDPLHGRGRGILHCIDATQTGDITKTGKIWSYNQIERSLSTVSIADGLLLIADYPGRLHCLNADTGQCYWIHDAKSDVWSSTLVADEKVFLGTRKQLWVLAAAKEKAVLAEISLGSPIRSAPVAANGALYVASQRYLWAVRAKQP
jgi:outer membrane protein assembly factor BamB